MSLLPSPHISFQVSFKELDPPLQTASVSINKISVISIFNIWVYPGIWDDWKGHGEINYTDGTKYGQGTYYTKNGDKYTGQWNGNYEGQGEINYKDGTKYKGYWDWKDGGFKRHGQGILYSADGQVLNKGKWDKDKYKGKE